MFPSLLEHLRTKDEDDVEQRVCLADLLLLKPLSQMHSVGSYPSTCLYLHTFYLFNILYIEYIFYILYLHICIFLLIFIPIPVDLNLFAH